VAVGGGSQSTAWLQTVANALQLPVQCPADGDFGAALGAARLGLLAAQDADPQHVFMPPAIGTVFEPNASSRAAYEDSYDRYRRLYPTLADHSEG